jgi:2-succinyl-5-enolpyruvyl-6-hydroxy-3-cyclohexene-1-carboxylate synthase
MAAESGEPVVLSCTGATASRNYYPGLTEAFYRKLPVLAITSHQGTDRIGQLVFQNIDRRVVANDIAKLSVELPVVRDKRDEDFVTMEANKAILELRRNGDGPVHINLFTTYSDDFSVEVIPAVKAFKRFMAWDKLPEMSAGRIAVFVGVHAQFTKQLEQAVDQFCATHDAVVICDHTSGYYGKYRLAPALVTMQHPQVSTLPKFDLIVHIGEISAAIYAYGGIHADEVWRVSEDGKLRDPFKKLTNVFQMSEEMFFNHYGNPKADKHELIDSLTADVNSIYDEIPELPFSNIWTAQQLSACLPKGSLFHISASNSRRCWNMFRLPEDVQCTSNVGCCGIDGCTSSMIGSSLASPNRICYLVTGDLAFFYDLNSLGNRHIGKNVRILLINNGIGAEFKLNSHKCYKFHEDADKFMAAGGHFGNKSHELVKHYATDLGFMYLSATNKDDFMAVLDEFAKPEIGDQPIILEVFTNHEDEDAAYKAMCSIWDYKKPASERLKEKARSILGPAGISIAKKILGK